MTYTVSESPVSLIARKKGYLSQYKSFRVEQISWPRRWKLPLGAARD